MKIIINSLVFLFLVNTLSVSAQEKTCTSIDECKSAIIEQGLKRETDKYGMTKEDSNLAQSIRSLDIDTTPMLVNLLEHQSFGVRRLAGFTLQGVNEIDPKYLSKIKAALDTTPWLVRALGRINLPSAAQEAVKRYSTASSSPHNGEGYAVKHSKERAVPFIMDLIKCKTGCPKGYVYNFGVLLSEMEVEKEFLVRELSNVIADKSLSDETLTGVIDILSFFEKDALSAEPVLSQLIKDRPRLEPAINNAFIRMGTDKGIKLLIESIASEPSTHKMLELAKHGELAKPAAPVLIQLLSQDDFELRQISARTLGFIGNPIAEDVLVSQLDNDSDVVLSVIAAQSLGELKSENSLVALNIAKEEHWYPPVRKAAKEAIDIINGKQQTSEDREIFRSYYSIMENPYLTQKVCEHVPLARLKEAQNEKLYKNDSIERLKQLSYDTHVISYGASDETDQVLNGNEIIEVTAENMVEHRTPLKQVPDMALKVDGGWLVGSSRGEWGGELVYVGKGGTTKKVLSANIEDIYKLGGAIISTTGLAHLGMNDGMIYKFARDENDNWVADEWIKLPGSPKSSWFVETGELLINVLRGGTLLLSKDGTMRVAPCKGN
ncbi:HEAT repeat domain-containing protein [uncultured Psychrosphaera sp.]|uniref:HEAT repeat domain-containing protein n=1 Tax=uncultured Psychrosphaera sp. TaxID=1403522 RepID=UPI002623CC5B|nr:HEAT repeat domain-containing protein [uncultured Psychrosphaera sp.]